MRPLIRILFAVQLIWTMPATVSAGDGSVKPVHIIRIQKAQIEKVNGFLSTEFSIQTVTQENQAGATEKTVRICTCQILDLESHNYSHQRVVLLAEKTAHGESSDYTAARKRISREKKQLKQMFYDKVKTVAETQSSGSCKALYFRLKTADSQLQLYEILNADVY